MGGGFSLVGGDERGRGVKEGFSWGKRRRRRGGGRRRGGRLLWAEREGDGWKEKG